MTDEKKSWYSSIPTAVILWCLTMAFSVGIIYSTVQDAPKKHDELHTYTQKVEAKADENKKVSTKNSKNVAVMANDIAYIKQGIVRIEKALMRPRRRER